MISSNWQYSPRDATSLAAIRWYANMIEAFSIELYATSPQTFSHTEHVLKHALEQLSYQRQRLRDAGAETECPDGYDFCRGLCRPTCDSLE